MNFKDTKKENQVKDVKYLEDKDFKILMNKLIRENLEALKRLAKK